MGFWETALAAFVGALGVLAIGGLAKFAWLQYRVRYTAYGRLVLKTGLSVEEHLKRVEQQDLD